MAGSRSATPRKQDRNLPPTPPRGYSKEGGTAPPSKRHPNMPAPPIMQQWEANMASCAPAMSSKLPKNVTSTPATAAPVTPEKHPKAIGPPPFYSPPCKPRAALGHESPIDSSRDGRRRHVRAARSASPQKANPERIERRRASAELHSCLQRQQGKKAYVDHISFKDTRRMASIHLIDQDLPAHAHLSQGLGTKAQETGAVRSEPHFVGHGDRGQCAPRTPTPEKSRQGSVRSVPSLPQLQVACKVDNAEAQGSSGRAASLPPASKERRHCSGSGIKELLARDHVALADTPRYANRAISLPPAVGASGVGAVRTPRRGSKEREMLVPAPGSTLPRSSSRDSARQWSAPGNTLPRSSSKEQPLVHPPPGSTPPKQASRDSNHRSPKPPRPSARSESTSVNATAVRSGSRGKAPASKHAVEHTTLAHAEGQRAHHNSRR